MEVDDDHDEQPETQSRSMITALSWVRKGYAKATLEVHEPGYEELQA